MSKFDDIDMSYGSGGELTFSKKDPEVEEQPTEEDSEEPSQESAPNLEKALKDTQAWGHQLAADKAALELRLKDLEAKIEGKGEKQEDLIPEGVALADILSDNDQGLSFLKKIVQLEASRLVNEQMAGVAPMLQEYKLTQEVREAAQRYGTDFVSRIENGSIVKTMEWYERTYPGKPPLTFEQAYFLVKQSEERNGKQPQSGTGGSRPQSSGNVQAAVERARKLTTERGVASTGQKPDSRVTTVDAAVEKALEDMFQ